MVSWSSFIVDTPLLQSTTTFPSGTNLVLFRIFARFAPSPFSEFSQASVAYFTPLPPPVMFSPSAVLQSDGVLVSWVVSSAVTSSVSSQVDVYVVSNTPHSQNTFTVPISQTSYLLSTLGCVQVLYPDMLHQIVSNISKFDWCIVFNSLYFCRLHPCQSEHAMQVETVTIQPVSPSPPLRVSHLMFQPRLLHL
jgi:hypothetical protein